jgi:hypothetical protein
MTEYHLVFAKIDSEIISEEYLDHKDAYNRYYGIVHKLRKKLIKKNLTHEDNQYTTDGYDRIFECSLGIVTCGIIPKDLMI